jgi:hypothetical protein
MLFDKDSNYLLQLYLTVVAHDLNSGSCRTYWQQERVNAPYIVCVLEVRSLKHETEGIGVTLIIFKRRINDVELATPSTA